MIPIHGIDHLVLRIRDVEAMLDFYCGALGCSVERRNDGIGLIQLRAGQSLIDLVPMDGKLGREGGGAPDANARNLDHFCLRVDPFDELDEVLDATITSGGSMSSSCLTILTFRS